MKVNKFIKQQGYLRLLEKYDNDYDKIKDAIYISTEIPLDKDISRYIREMREITQQEIFNINTNTIFICLKFIKKIQ